MVVQVQAFTSYNSTTGYSNPQWINITSVTYADISNPGYVFATLGCGGAACVPTQLRLVTISVTEAHVEMAHYINNQLQWVGDFVPDSLVQGLPQQCVFSALETSDISVAIGNTFEAAVSCKDSCGNYINCPSFGFSWSSSNPAIATVSNSTTYAAIVTGIKVGTATITVSNQGITTSRTITVTCTTPKYKCSGTQCISDNCDGTGIYTTSNCNNVCNPICTTPKYKCSGTQCISDNCDGTGIYTINNCNDICAGGGGTGWTCDSVTCPNDGTNYCLQGTCIPKQYVIYGAAAFGALLILSIVS